MYRGDFLGVLLARSVAAHGGRHAQLQLGQNLATAHWERGALGHGLGRSVVANWGVGGRQKARCLGMYLVSLSLSLSTWCVRSEWALHKPSMHVGMASTMRTGAPMLFVQLSMRWKGVMRVVWRMLRGRPPRGQNGQFSSRVLTVAHGRSMG